LEEEFRIILEYLFNIENRKMGMMIRPFWVGPLAILEGSHPPMEPTPHMGT